MKFALLITMLMGTAAWPGEVSAPSPEDLFKWGEYDSLVRVLEPSLESTGAGDSAEMARSNLLLGVAYFATGRPDQAEHAFVQACRLDARVQLETFYVTREIADRFEAVAAREKARRAASAPRPGRPAAKTKGWWLGGAAAAAALGGAYLILTLEPPKPSVTQIDTRDNQ